MWDGSSPRVTVFLAATNNLVTIRCRPGKVGCCPLHRFGTDLLDARADRWQVQPTVDNSPSGKETHGNNSDREQGGPHGAIPLDANWLCFWHGTMDPECERERQATAFNCWTDFSHSATRFQLVKFRLTRFSWKA